jgi:hypothetical protein
MIIETVPYRERICRMRLGSYKDKKETRLKRGLKSLYKLDN